MSEMNGVFLGSRPIRCAPANSKDRIGGTVLPRPSQRQQMQPERSDADNSHNTTIFVGGIDNMTTEEMMRASFIRFGEIHSIKIPQGKGYGFIQFFKHESAEIAIQSMNGAIISEFYLYILSGF
jgi:RNA recognition motif-containing protein